MNKVEYETEGVIFNIQRYSLHDGPHSNHSFFKGCPLSCKWCSNPESQRHSPELLFKKNDCIRCGKCIDACPQQALSTTNAWFINRDRCIQCGKCTEICPTRALEMKGKRMSVTAVMRELEKEENLYGVQAAGLPCPVVNRWRSRNLPASCLKPVKPKAGTPLLKQAASPPKR